MMHSFHLSLDSVGSKRSSDRVSIEVIENLLLTFPRDERVARALEPRQGSGVDEVETTVQVLKRGLLPLRNVELLPDQVFERTHFVWSPRSRLVSCGSEFERSRHRENLGLGGLDQLDATGFPPLCLMRQT